MNSSTPRAGSHTRPALLTGELIGCPSDGDSGPTEEGGEPRDESFDIWRVTTDGWALRTAVLTGIADCTERPTLGDAETSREGRAMAEEVEGRFKDLERICKAGGETTGERVWDGWLLPLGIDIDGSRDDVCTGPQILCPGWNGAGGSGGETVPDFADAADGGEEGDAEV